MGLLYLPLQTFRRIQSVLQASQNRPGSQQWVHPRIHTPHIDLLRPPGRSPRHSARLSGWTAGAPGRRLSAPGSEEWERVRSREAAEQPEATGSQFRCCCGLDGMGWDGGGVAAKWINSRSSAEEDGNEVLHPQGRSGSGNTPAQRCPAGHVTLIQNSWFVTNQDALEHLVTPTKSTHHQEIVPSLGTRR